MLDSTRIAAIRKELQQIGCASATTPAFQNQLLSYLDMNADRGDFLIEVGCFRGGMTAQLAYYAVERGKRFYVVDICDEYLQTARNSVKTALGKVPGCVEFVKQDLTTFLGGPQPSQRCLLVFIDGDHHYDGVVRDIKAVVNSSLERPLTICFHDYGLRCTAEGLTDVRVDKAIHDILPKCAVSPIGEIAGLGGILPVDPVRHSGEHFPRGLSEGVMVVLNDPRPFTSRLDPSHGRLKRLVKAALHAGRRS